MKTTHCDQYEPLVTPQAWQGDERRFAIRLRQLLDILFHRLGHVERRLQALETQKGDDA